MNKTTAAQWIREYLSGNITEHELVSGCLPHTSDWIESLTKYNLTRLIPQVQKVVDIMRSSKPSNPGTAS